MKSKSCFKLAATILAFATIPTFIDSASAGKLEKSRKLTKSSTTFEIDCYGKNISDTGTSNTITIQFWNSNTKVGEQSSVPGCNWANDAIYSIQGTPAVTHVTVETGGGDALWIDEARLKRRYTYDITYEKDTVTQNGIEKRYETDSESFFSGLGHWGRDGGKGYCVSTDANDNVGAWANKVDDRGCFKKFAFQINPLTAKGLEQGRNNISYALSIHTGTSRGAGTDSNVFVQQIVGSKGTINPNQRLNGFISGNAFENGDVDKVTLSQQADVGDVTSLTIKTDGRYSGSGWQLNKIDVTSNGKKVTLNCGNVWLDGDSTTCK